MKTDGKILIGLAFAFAGACWYESKKKANVGDLSNLKPYGAKIIKNLKELKELIKSGEAGNINNGRIVLNRDSNHYINVDDSVKRAIGLDRNYLLSGKELSLAYHYLKEQDRGFVFFDADSLFHLPQDKIIFAPSRQDRLTSIINNLGICIDDDCKTDQDGYLATLVKIANGQKFRWNNTADGKGLKSEIIATKGPAPMERKARRFMLSETDGLTPDKFAESITEFGGDDNAVKQGVLQALSEVNSPQEAYNLLCDIDDKNKENNPDEQNNITPDDNPDLPF